MAVSCCGGVQFFCCFFLIHYCCFKSTCVPHERNRAVHLRHATQNRILAISAGQYSEVSEEIMLAITVNRRGF